MLFTFVVPSLLLLAAVNGAVLPQRRDNQLERKDLLDDIGSFFENLPQELPGIIDAVESLLGDPAATDGGASPTDGGASPTDDGVGFLFPPAATVLTAPSDIPSDIPATPTSAGASLGPASAVPFPSLAVVDPENPAGVPLPGTPFMVTAPAAPPAAITPPARRSRLNGRSADMEKRLDIDNIVNAVLSALPSGVQQDVAPIVHDLIGGAAPATPSAANGAQPTSSGQSLATGENLSNAASSVRGNPSVTLTGSLVVIASVVLGAAVVL